MRNKIAISLLMLLSVNITNLKEHNKNIEHGIDPVCIIKESISPIIKDIIHLRELKGDYYSFVVSIASIDTINMKMDFSVDFIMKENEYLKVNPTCFLKIENEVVLIKSNTGIVLEDFNFERINNKVERKVKK